MKQIQPLMWKSAYMSQECTILFKLDNLDVHMNSMIVHLILLWAYSMSHIQITIVTKLNDSQLAKLKKSIPVMLLLWNFRVEAVGLQNSNYTIFVNIKFGAISWKIDILAITAQLKFESENSFAHMLLI